MKAVELPLNNKTEYAVIEHGLSKIILHPEGKITFVAKSIEFITEQQFSIKAAQIIVASV